MTNTAKKTVLYHFHSASGAKIAPFAGYDMPISYPLGTVKEHLHVRQACGVFDVSHMGQFILEGRDSVALLHKLTPMNVEDKKIGQSSYTVLLNENGGIVDDCIITKLADESFFLVLNAACKEKDTNHIHAFISTHFPHASLTELTDRALIAIQGPEAESTLSSFTEEDLSLLPFMHMAQNKIKGEQAYIFRSGYTGEDGFEISIPNHIAETLTEEICKNKHVQAIGLAARDTLRLEAGLPLYGHDLSDETSPIEANLTWIVDKTRTGYLGEERLRTELEKGVSRKRMGVRLREKGIAREDAVIYNYKQEPIGTLTSGGYCPSHKESIGQAYIQTEYAAVGTKVYVEVRGKLIEAEIHTNRFLKKK